MRQTRRIKYLAPLFAILVTIMPSAFGQYLQETGSPTFATSESVPMGFVNVANGNLHIEIPLAATPGRGGSAVVAKMVYDSRIWQIVDTGSSQSWQPTNVPDTASGVPDQYLGWRFLITGHGRVMNDLVANTCYYSGNPETWYQYQNYRFDDIDGTVRKFPLYYESGNDCHTAATSTSSGPSLDATGYKMDWTTYVTLPEEVVAPSGTKVYHNVSGSAVVWQDTNGNYITKDNSTGDIIDTLNRTVVTKTVVSSTETDYTVLNSQGSSTYKVYFNATPSITTAFGVSGITEYSASSGPPTVNEIDLPDGSKYHFRYETNTFGSNGYGLLNGINLPTGTQTGSTYDTTFTYTNFTDVQGNVQRWVSDMTTGGGTTTYTPATCGSGCEKMTVTRPSGDDTVYTFTVNSAGAWNTQTQAYSGSASSGTLLTTAAMTYDTSLSNPVTGGIGFVRQTSVTSTVPGGSANLTSETSATYDTFTYSYRGTNYTGSRGNVATANQYAYGTGGSPGGLLSQNVFTYLHDSNSNYLNRNIVNRATDVLTKDGSGTKIAEKTVTYDSGSLTSVTGTTHHDDTNFGTGFSYRGNSTGTQSCVTWSGSTCSVTYSGATMAYDTLGNLRTSTDPNSNTTTYSYTDSFYTDNGSNPPSTYTPSTATNAFVTSTSVPILGSSTKGYYWGSGKTAVSTDTNSQTSYQHFQDSLDRPTNTTLPNGGSTTTSYPSNSAVNTSTAITGSTNLQTSMALDDWARPVTQTLTDPDGNSTVTRTYNNNGEISNITNSERSTSSSTDGSTSASYDGLGRITTVTEADGSAKQTFYAGTVGSNGGITTQLCSTSTYGIGIPTLTKTEAGKKRETWADVMGRTIETDEPDSGGSLTMGTCYKFDVMGNLIEVDQGSQTRTFSYDGMGRLTSQTTSEGGTVNTYYTTSGGALCAGNQSLPCRVTDARSVTTTYTYDALNRVTGKTYSNSDPSIAYYYDQTSCSSFSGFSITNGKGRRTCMTDGSGATAWSYDAEGDVLTQKRTIGSVTKTISYTYTTGGMPSTITYPSGLVVTNSYNAAGRPTQVSCYQSGCWDYPYAYAFAGNATYAATGQLTSVLLGYKSGFSGITISTTYNNRLQPVNLKATHTAGTVTLLDHTYSFVSSSINDGLVKSISNNLSSARSQSYTYDEMDRLATAQSSATSGSDCWGLSYSYDRYANLIAESSTKCSTPTLSLSVSSSTNQIINTGFTYDSAGNLTGDGTNTYTWNASGLMASTAGVNYSYDGDGLRVKKAASSPSQYDKLYWYGADGRVLAESDLSGSITSEYVYFGGTRIARRDVSSGNVYYFLGDRLGNARVLTDSTGTVVEASDYYPYGQERVISGTGTVNNYKYTGDERDGESSLDHTQYRQLSSALGRWLSTDPVSGNAANPQSWNRYAYVQDTPVNLTDPDGRIPCDEFDDDCGVTIDGPDCDPSMDLCFPDGGGDGYHCQIGGSFGMQFIPPPGMDCADAYCFMFGCGTPSAPPAAAPPPPPPDMGGTSPSGGACGSSGCTTLIGEEEVCDVFPELCADAVDAILNYIRRIVPVLPFGKLRVPTWSCEASVHFIGTPNHAVAGDERISVTVLAPTQIAAEQAATPALVAIAKAKFGNSGWHLQHPICKRVL